MKIFISTILITLLFSVAALAQTEKQVSAVRSKVNAINKSSKKYTHTTRSVEGLSLEGSEATYFLLGNEIKKINVKMYGETYRSTAEIFLEKGKPLFIFQRVERYDTHVAANPPPKVVNTTEKRVYFNDDDVIRILSGKTKLEKGSTDYDETVYELVELTDMIKAAYDQ